MNAARQAVQFFGRSRFGHDAPLPGALWQVPARRLPIRRVGALARARTKKENPEAGQVSLLGLCADNPSEGMLRAIQQP